MGKNEHLLSMRVPRAGGRQATHLILMLLRPPVATRLYHQTIHAHIILLDSRAHCAQGDVVRCEAPLTVLSLALSDPSRRDRKFEKEEKGRKYHRVERAYGSFVRSFSLPEDADGSRVSADFKDGMLQVHLPKSQKAKPKAIEIKVG